MKRTNGFSWDRRTGEVCSVRTRILALILDPLARGVVIIEGIICARTDDGHLVGQ